MPSNITRKLIQLLGKSIYDNRRKIRKKMLSSLSFLTYRDQSCLETLNKLLSFGFWFHVEHELA